MPSISWNRMRAAHLYRRAGFGATREELDRAVEEGREATVSRLVDFESIPNTALEQRLASYNFDLTTFYEIEDPRSFVQILNFQRWFYLRMTYSARPLQEKLLLFWHNHFATSYAKVPYGPLFYDQMNLFLQRGAGNFEPLLLGVARDPLMLFFLDNNTNIKDALQENWGRELLELLSMGVNNGYTQADVRAAAAAFTGWTTEDTVEARYAFRFVPEFHDFGNKVFLGLIGPWDGTDIIRILVRRPETAKFMTDKLARFFLGRNPRTPLSRRLQDLWLSGGANIREICRTILLSDDMDEAADRADQIKSPTELYAGALRTLGATSDASNGFLFGVLTGQTIAAPPNVAGWPPYTHGTHRWFSTGTDFARIHFANDLAGARPGTPTYGWSAEAFYAGAQVRNPEELIADLEFRFAMRFSESLKAGLRHYLSGAGALFAWNAAARDRWGRGAVRLVLSSPDYHVQ